MVNDKSLTDEFSGLSIKDIPCFNEPKEVRIGAAVSLETKKNMEILRRHGINPSALTRMLLEKFFNIPSVKDYIESAKKNLPASEV